MSRRAGVAVICILGLVSAAWLVAWLGHDPASGRIIPAAPGPALGLWVADDASVPAGDPVGSIQLLDLGSDGTSLVANLRDGSVQRTKVVWSSPTSAAFTLRNRAGRLVALSIYQPGAGSDIQVSDPGRTVTFSPRR